MTTPKWTHGDTIILNLDCDGCGLELRVTIPLHAVELVWSVTCPDCVKKEVLQARSRTLEEP